MLAMNNCDPKKPYIMAPKYEILKYKSNKYVHDLYAENYKMLMRKIKELNEWKDIVITDMTIVTVKISILPKLVYRFHAIPIKIPDFPIDIDKLVLNFEQEWI